MPFQAEAEKTRLISESFAKAAEINFDLAAKAINKVADSGKKTTASLEKLAGVNQSTAQSNKVVTDAVTETAQALDKESEAAKKSATEAKAAADEKVAEMLKVTDALKAIGVTSDAERQRQADAARHSFEVVRDHADSTELDIQRVFIASSNF